MSERPRWRGLPIPGLLRALRHRNYRLFIAGQIVSLVGNWIQGTALNWLVLNVLMASSFQLGVFNFALQVPVLLLGLFAGALVDTVNRHRLLLVTQGLFMVHAVVLAVLTLLHHGSGAPLLTYPLAVGLAFVSGVLQAFDLPARSAFLLQMVPREDLQNAVALNSLTFNGARVIGPALAGTLLAWFSRAYSDRLGFGEGLCFVMNAVSYIAVLLSLLQMRVEAPPADRKADYSPRYLLDGIRYVAARPHIAGLLLHLTIMALFGIPYLLLIPVFAREVLHGDASVFGRLMASIGIGALAGGVIMAMRKGVRGLGRHMTASTAAFAICILVFARMDFLWSASLAIGAAGFSMVMAMIGSQTLAQTLVAENVRGRVLSLYTMISVGMLPFGSLISGALAQYFGVRTAFTINGAVCLLTALGFSLTLPRLRAWAHATEEYQQAVAEPV
ncbi:MAG: MFS transporter [Candidatus Sumerlaeaceae bacterium]